MTRKAGGNAPAGRLEPRPFAPIPLQAMEMACFRNSTFAFKFTKVLTPKNPVSLCSAAQARNLTHVRLQLK